MASTFGQLRCMFQKLSLGLSPLSETFVQTRNYAARKGTRERKAKILKALKVKKLARQAQQEKMLGYDPKMKYLRKKNSATRTPDYLRNKEYELPEPTDNVYESTKYRWKIYSFLEAVEAHRQALHPTMLDAPNSMLQAQFELSMIGVKKTRPLLTFNSIVSVPHPFDHGEERNIAVFCKSQEGREEARDNGAAAVFGVAEIKDILKGEISLLKYPVFIAHPDIMTELMTIKGLMKKAYPSMKTGTINQDLKLAIHTQLHGIKYSGMPYESHKGHGVAEVPLGLLDIDEKHLEENFISIIQDLQSKKPKRPGPFILRTCLLCPPNTEKFKIDFEKYIDEKEDAEEETEEDIAVISPA